MIDWNEKKKHTYINAYGNHLHVVNVLLVSFKGNFFGNLAQFRPATQSTIYQEGDEARCAVDGQLTQSTCRSVTSNWDLKPWWKVRLAFPTWVFQVEINSLIGECIMTSSNGNIFRVTGPLCGEFTAHWWILRTCDVILMKSFVRLQTIYCTWCLNIFCVCIELDYNESQLSAYLHLLPHICIAELHQHWFR